MNIKKLRVSRLSGQSSVACIPDTVANKTIKAWGFVPEDTSDPDSLYSSALTNGTEFHIIVNEQTQRVKLVVIGDEKPIILDNGRMIRMSQTNDVHGAIRIEYEGIYLFKTIVICTELSEEEKPEEEHRQAPAVHVEMPDKNIGSPETDDASGIIVVERTSQPQLTVVIPVNRIRRNEGQPRKNFKRNALVRLGDSLKDHGQNDPIEVIVITGDPNAEYELVKGERRWRAAQAVGLKTLEAIVKRPDQVPNKEIQHRRCFIADFHHENYSRLEIALALRDQKKAGATLPELVSICGKNEEWVKAHLAINNLVPQLQDLLDQKLPQSQQLSFPIARQLSRLPPEKQLGVFSEIKKIKGAAFQLLEAKRIAESSIRIEDPQPKRKHGSGGKRRFKLMVPRIAAELHIAGQISEKTFEELVLHTSSEEVQEIFDQLKAVEKSAGSIHARITALKNRT